MASQSSRSRFLREPCAGLQRYFTARILPFDSTHSLLDSPCHNWSRQLLTLPVQANPGLRRTSHTPCKPSLKSWASLLLRGRQFAPSCPQPLTHVTVRSGTFSASNKSLWSMWRTGAALTRRAPVCPHSISDMCAAMSQTSFKNQTEWRSACCILSYTAGQSLVEIRGAMVSVLSTSRAMGKRPLSRPVIRSLCLSVDRAPSFFPITAGCDTRGLRAESTVR
mmetsp:Transcript_55451/g.125151  ORF Transcript_55451/g.125151 Transcript_55451/m.125151 type:complete len:222 (-) Transcript_55451:623-1288(-)